MSVAIDITQQQHQLLLDILNSYIPGTRVWAYGSRVKFCARANSDLDLVVFTSPQQKGAVYELKDELDESDLPFMVDVHVWDELPEEFHRIILMQYVVLQDGEQHG